MTSRTGVAPKASRLQASRPGIRGRQAGPAPLCPRAKERHDIGKLGTTEQNDIIARTTINHGAEAIIQQHVIACAPQKAIAAQAAHQRILSIPAGDDVIPCIAKGAIVTRPQQHPFNFMQRIGAKIADKRLIYRKVNRDCSKGERIIGDIDTRPTIQPVIIWPARECIDPCIPNQRIGTRITPEEITAAIAKDAI